MEFKGFEYVLKLFISLIEQLMDKFKWSVKEFHGLFKIRKENTLLVSANTLYQQICITATDQFESINCECNLFGLDFTKDEQISNWKSRTQGNYRTTQLFNTAEGFRDVNRTKKTFNFLKSWETASINNETDMLHPGTHKF